MRAERRWRGPGEHKDVCLCVCLGGGYGDMEQNVGLGTREES